MPTVIPTLLLAATADDKYIRFGYAFWSLILFWGVYRCWRASRRPDANAKAALSLGAFLGGLMLFAVGLLIGGPDRSMPLFMLLVFVGFGLLSTAFVLAVLGLLEIRQDAAGRRGKARAWTTLGLCLAMAGAVGLGGLYKIASSISDSTEKPWRARALEDFTSQRYGYSVKLSGSGWRHWANLDEDVDGAELGGLLGPGGAFVAIPVDLHGLDPPLDALASALLDGLDVALDDPVIDARRSEEDGLEILDLDYWRSIDGEKWIYKLRVSKSERFGYLVGVWRKADGDLSDEALEDLLARVSIDPEHVTPAEAPELGSAELTFQSRIINDTGLMFSSDDLHQLSVPYFLRAFEINPNDGVILENAIDGLSRTERYDQALELLAANEDRFGSNLDLLSYRPYLEMRLGKNEKAAEDYAALFARGHDSTWDLSDYLDLLWEMDRQDDALAAVAGFRETRDSGHAARLEADLHERRGDFDGGIEVLRQRRFADPDDHELGRALAYALIEADKLVEASELAASLVEDDPESSDNHFVLGRSRYSQGDFGDAKAAFEDVLALRPGHRSAREYLDHVSALLGEGENSSIKKEIEAVEIPERMLLTLDAPESERDHGDLGAYYVDRVTAISFERGEDYRRTEHRLVRISERKALEVFSTFEYTFDPLSEEIYVNRVMVRDAAGEVVAEGNVSDYYLSDPPDDGMATQDKQVNIPVPGLEPGHSVELVITRRYRNPPEKMPFLRFTPVTAHVVRNGVLLVRGDVEDLVYQARSGPLPEKADGELVWRVKRPGPFRWEPYGADADSYLPYLWLGSKQDSWADLGASYLEDIAERLEPHPLVAELGVQLARGLEEREARVDALASYVQGYSYQAIEFGRRARMPLPVEDVVARKYGDCKDHSLLLYHLLRANDVPAELMLVNNSTDVLAKVPSLDQFNHMIVHVPGDGVGRFLDGTGKDHRITGMPPFGLGGRLGLLLGSERSRLVRLPEYSADQNRVISERSVELLAGGDARVRETLTLTGVSAANIRGALKNVDEPTRRNMIQQTMSERGPRVTVRELQTRHLDAAEEPLVLEIDYLLEERLQPAGEELVGRIPANWEQWFLAAAPVEGRRTPFRVTYPLRLESKVTVSPAAGLEILTREVETPHQDRFSSWSVRQEPSAEGPIFHWSLRLEAGDPPAELYAGFEQSMSRAVRSIERQVRLVAN
ncbi:MAG: DUF3857 domain-containing protein [bacterium]|nr:DUF3857 domain-containing protein [bacterium]